MNIDDVEVGKPKHSEGITIKMPEEVKEKLKQESFRRRCSMGRILIDAWVKTLNLSEQKSVRELMGVRRTVNPEEQSKYPPCPICGIVHVRMPSRGPWHDATCPNWSQRGLN